jgi:hypothetical protein
VIVEPFAFGVDQLTVTCAAPATTEEITGASGVPGAGVTLDEAAEGTLDPTAFVSITLKVYVSPFVKPVTTQVVAVVVTHVSPPFPEVVVSVAVTV